MSYWLNFKKSIPHGRNNATRGKVIEGGGLELGGRQLVAGWSPNSTFFLDIQIPHLSFSHFKLMSSLLVIKIDSSNLQSDFIIHFQLKGTAKLLNFSFYHKQVKTLFWKSVIVNFKLCFCSTWDFGFFSLVNLLNLSASAINCPSIDNWRATSHIFS